MGKIELKGVGNKVTTPKENVVQNKKRVVQGKEVIDIYIQGVRLTYLKLDNIDYSSIKTLIDVIELEKSQNILVDIYPPLYKRFLDKDNFIKTYVNIGDSVEYRNSKTEDINVLFNLGILKQGVVKNIRLCNLMDMSVIVADYTGIVIEKDKLGNTIEKSVDEAVLSFYLKPI